MVSKIIDVIWVYLIVMPVTYFIWVFVHELGHGLATLMMKLKIHAFVVRPLIFEKENNKLKFRFSLKDYKGCFGRVNLNLLVSMIRKILKSLIWRLTKKGSPRKFINY